MRAYKFFLLLILTFGIFLPCSASIPYPPKTLRDRFEKSDVVVIARYDSTGEWDEGRKNVNYTNYLRPIRLQVEEFIKGAPVDVNLGDYVSVDDDDDKAARLDRKSRFAEFTKPRIFFLWRDDNGTYHEVTGVNGSVTVYDIVEKTEKYAPLLRQLNAIYTSSGENFARDINDWLLSLAEEKETLYDAATDLQRSFIARGKEKHEPEKKVPENDKDPLNFLFSFDETAPSDFARALTDEQKERWLNLFEQHVSEPHIYWYIVLDEDGDEDEVRADDLDPAAGNATPYGSFFGSGKEDLLDIAIELDKTRVLKHLVPRLPWLARYILIDSEDILERVAKLSGRDDLQLLIDQYENVSTGRNEKIVKDPALAYDLDAERAAFVKNYRERNPDTEKTDEKILNKFSVKKLPKKTYLQRRAEIIDQIMKKLAE